MLEIQKYSVLNMAAEPNLVNSQKSTRFRVAKRKNHIYELNFQAIYTYNT